MQKADYKNKQLKAEEVKDTVVQKQSYIFPEHGIIIEAENTAEAEALLSKKLKSNQN